MKTILFILLSIPAFSQVTLNYETGLMTIQDVGLVDADRIIFVNTPTYQAEIINEDGSYSLYFPGDIDRIQYQRRKGKYWFTINFGTWSQEVLSNSNKTYKEVIKHWKYWKKHKFIMQMEKFPECSGHMFPFEYGAENRGWIQCIECKRKFKI